MPPDSFLHERNDFKALVATAADSERINDPALVEKDSQNCSRVNPVKIGLPDFHTWR